MRKKKKMSDPKGTATKGGRGSFFAKAAAKRSEMEETHFIATVSWAPQRTLFFFLFSLLFFLSDFVRHGWFKRVEGGKGGERERREKKTAKRSLSKRLFLFFDPAAPGTQQDLKASSSSH